jgi:hypothetical protein
MPRATNSNGGALSHLSSVPITVSFALLVIGSLAVLIVLKHLFASINVSAGTK